MTFYLKLIYKDKYDGIIMEHKLPNIIQNGYQHPEIFIFDENNVDFLGQYIPPTPGGGKIITKNKNYTRTKINPFVMINVLHTHREAVLDNEHLFPQEEVKKYKNYEYIDEVEHQYGVTLPRPADAPPPKNQTVSETQKEIKTGGAKKKHRYTRRRSRNI